MEEIRADWGRGLSDSFMERLYVEYVEKPGDRKKGIKVTLLALGMSRAEAAEAIGMSIHTVNMALSTGDREAVLDRLEDMLKERLKSIR